MNPEMSGALEIVVVVLAVAGAVGYMGLRGYRRFVLKKAAACGGCAGACGGEEARDSSGKQVVSSINLLTTVTAEDRRA